MSIDLKIMLANRINSVIMQQIAHSPSGEDPMHRYLIKLTKLTFVYLLFSAGLINGAGPVAVREEANSNQAKTADVADFDVDKLADYEASIAEAVESGKIVGCSAML